MCQLGPTPDPCRPLDPDAERLLEKLAICEFSQGVCLDGAAILKDGQPMQIDQIMEALHALQYLVRVKEHKDSKGKDRWYYEARNKAWRDAKRIVSI